MLNENNVGKRNNEDMSSPHLSDAVDSPAKKRKIDSSEISKVVHLRGLPTDVSDIEVIRLGMKYGTVINALMLKGKNQAFLEMENEDDAQKMVTQCEIDPPVIQRRIIYIQFSNHKHLKTDNSSNQMKTQATLHALQKSERESNHVLLALVDKMIYPITLDVLHTIFSKFGNVLRIVMFNKNNQFQALIEMGNAEQSQMAKLSLDGQNIYNACCTLRIEYSKLTSLRVKSNSEKSCDYTKIDISSGRSAFLRNASLQSIARMMHPPYSNAASLSSAVFEHSQLANFAINTNALRGNNIQNNAITAQLTSIVGAGNSVLHVSNLNEKTVTPQVLFILFGVYGDVMRVKILYQKKHIALVQMADHAQAQIVIKYLHGVVLFGRPLQIVMSKYNEVQMPREGRDVENLTQDYSNSSLHRFKKPGSKNFQNIFPPSEILHLSNIPTETKEEFLKESFSQHGTVHGFKFFTNDRRMALIKLGSVEEAVNCLLMLHNFKVSDTNNLRVSFSRGHAQI